MQNDFQFPKDFLWGAAVSAHQAEGGNRNDWSEWERANSKRLAAEAQKKEWPAFILEKYPNPFQPENYISGRACDHYNRFQEDFDIAKKLGHNAHRLSIEWSRIEPEEGRFDEHAIEHYREVVRALRERGMEPFVTLWHWTMPLWVRDFGGVASQKFPETFVRYAKYVAERLGSDVEFWMTLNEPTSVIANGYLRGVWPPQKKNIIHGMRVFRLLARAHESAYHAIKKIAPRARIGFGNIVTHFEPMRKKNSLDRLASRLGRFWTNDYFFSLTSRDTHDYIALQNYFHARVAFPWRQMNDNQRMSDMGWELYPESLYYLLKEWGTVKKPIYITENGLADAADAHRGWFIQESLKAVARAMEEGADARGYFYWSLLDNFEWDKGFWPRFGLVEVDYKTFERKIRPSAFEYKKIIDSGIIES